MLQGERDVASGNKSLGQFNLEGIPPSPRGMPQIEVTFDIDANGILHVRRKDKATAKENKITIKANSGLSDAEIDRMVKDAEAHAEEDRKQLEIVQARNQLDALVHSVKKSLAEYGDKIDADEKDKIEAALKDAEELLKQTDASKDAMEAKAQALMTASQKLGETMYAKTQADAAGRRRGRGRHEWREGKRREGGRRGVHGSQRQEVMFRQRRQGRRRSGMRSIAPEREILAERSGRLYCPFARPFVCG